jgi:flagellar biosynthesis protein FlhF
MGIQIKKFQAATLQQAIEQIRNEMGDNAVILQTEPIVNSGKFNFFGGKGVEVTAGIDRKELAPRFHATVADDEVATKASKASTVLEGMKSLFAGRTAKPAAKVFQSRSVLTPKPRPNAAAAAAFAQSAAATSATSTTTSAATPANDTQQLGQLYAMRTFVEPLQKEIDTLKAKLSKPAVLANARKKIKDPLELEVQSLRDELMGFITEKKFEAHKLPSYFRNLMRYWSERGVSKRQILSYFDEMQKWGEKFDETTSDQSAAATLNTALEGSIFEANVLEKSQKRIVVLVGPTGVGKTTSIVKMAAFEKIKLKRKVAFITIDDYKIGAVDQLSHYARILEVPFAKHRSDVSLEEECKVQNADTIFIDTFGVSAKDIDRIEALKSILSFKDPEMAKAIEIHLALPVGIPTADVQTSLDRFSELNPSYLLFTKWDETDNWGGMLSTILMSKKPVSFIGHGQNVPDDMALFSKKSFIETVTEILSN